MIDYVCMCSDLVILFFILIDDGFDYCPITVITLEMGRWHRFFDALMQKCANILQIYTQSCSIRPLSTEAGDITINHVLTSRR